MRRWLCRSCENGIIHQPWLASSTTKYIIAKQAGRPHPQSSDPEMRLYRVFVAQKKISSSAACWNTNYDPSQELHYDPYKS